MVPESPYSEDSAHRDRRDAANGVVVRGVTGGNDDGLLVLFEEPADGNEAMRLDVLSLPATLPVVVPNDVFPLDD